MKDTDTMAKAFLAASLVLPIAAMAALKYEPDSYVQNGLVLMLDGIRNAGALKAHDNSTERWVNLANPGNSAVLSNFTGTAANTSGVSEWREVGYYFDANRYWQTESNIGGTESSTIEVFGDFTQDQVAAYTQFAPLASGIDNGVFIQRSNGGLYWKLDGYGFSYSKRPNITSWDKLGFAATIDATSATLYASGATKSNTKTGRTADKIFPDCKWNIGCSYDAASYPVTGLYNTLRVYSRALSKSEIEANWTLDRIRFVTGIPVTNAVVATAVAGAEGVESSGVYAVDGTHAFSAPAVVHVGDKDYACAGYALERWESDDWGAPELHVDSLSVTVSESEKVRITWRWMPYGVHAASDYEVTDYIQDGLALHLDGIRNAGVDVPHDSAATTWKDLSYRDSSVKFASNDLTHWTDDGYYFTTSSLNKASYVYLYSKLSLGTNGTIEVACDIDKSIQTATHPQLVAFNHDGDKNYDMSVYLQGKSDLRWKADMWCGGASSTRANITEPWDGKHAAFVMDTTQYRSYKNGAVDQTQNRTTVTNMPTVYWMLGSKYKQNTVSDSQLIGTIKGVRAYTRALSDEEIAHNWKVDVARFDGLLTVTNVVVAGKYDNYEGVEPGEYEVDGRYTFTAGSATDASGAVRRVVGYTIEAWNPLTGDWDAPQQYEGDAYTYTVDRDPDKVRLTWEWRDAGLTIFVR